MKYTTFSKISLLLALLVTTLFSCVKTEFDEPPITGTPVDVQPNATIKQIKALHVTPDGFDKITEDLIIEGVVVMDDRSGNYYKTIVIQDATGGIEVKFNDGYLYNQYPIGRTLYIKCKDLMLTDYNGLIQLIGGTIEEGGNLNEVGITELQGRNQILKGLISSTPPQPRVITMDDISNPDYISTLVKIEDVEFIPADTAKTYADGVTKNSVNRTLQDCDSRQIVIRSSGYANFAGALTSGKHGAVSGILSAYGNTPQMYIRDVNDVQFNDARCPIQVTGIAGGNVVVETINETFSAATTNVDINFAGWSNYQVQGGRLWRGNAFSGDNYAQATSFGNAQPYTETWFITPGINVSTQKTLSFISSWAYYRHQGLSVWYSTNYNGTDFGTATWQPVNCTIAKQSDGSGNFSNWVPSGDVALPVLAGGKIHIAFKYTGDGSNTTTWRIDNVKVQ